MKETRRQLPDGVQDYLPQECGHKRALEARIRATLSLHGYQEVSTPSFERAEVFMGGAQPLPQENLYKLMDKRARLLCLRPEFTLPLAHLASGALRGETLPLRLCALGDVFAFPPRADGRGHEDTQADAELIGLPGPEGDAEVLALAIQCLRDTGLHSFQIDLGQVRFFTAVMAEAGVPQGEVETLRGFVEEKNNLALELHLQGSGLSDAVRRRILTLPRLYGGPDVLGEAERFVSGPESEQALRSLRDTLTLLDEQGLSRYVSIDLGLVQSIHYYTGITFRGITPQLGYPLLSGGRYDGLMGECGWPQPATGFALGLKALLVALERQGALLPMLGLDAVVGFESGEGRRAAAAAHAFRLRDAGLRVEVTPLGGEALVAHAKARGAGMAICVGQNGPNHVWEREAQ